MDNRRIQIVERIYDTKNGIDILSPRACVICMNRETSLKVIDDMILAEIIGTIEDDKREEEYTDIHVYTHTEINALGEIPNTPIQSVDLVFHTRGYSGGIVHEYRLEEVYDVVVLEDRILIR